MSIMHTYINISSSKLQDTNANYFNGGCYLNV